MADAMSDAVAGLQTARDEQARKVALEQARLEQLDKMLGELQNTILVVDPERLPRRQDYAGLGIVEAAKRWLTEVGGERSTREIWDEIHTRGVNSKSEDPIPTVYATLSNSSDFKRRGSGREGRWMLKEAK